MNEHEPLDDTDAATLGELRAMYEDLDPMPDDLVERVKFSLALDEMFEEVARMTRVPMEELSRARGAHPGHPHRDADLLRRATHRDGDREPDRPRAAAHRRLAGAERDAVGCGSAFKGLRRGRRPPTRTGRFSFEDLDEGFGQLSFHPLADAADDDDGQNAVVTPLFQL